MITNDDDDDKLKDKQTDDNPEPEPKDDKSKEGENQDQQQQSEKENGKGAEDEAPKNLIDDPLLAKLFEDLGEKPITPAPKEDEEGGDPDPDPKDDKGKDDKSAEGKDGKKAEDADKDKDKAKQKVKSRIIKNEPLPDVIPDPEPPAQSPPPAAPAPSPDEEYLRSLPEEVQEEIAEAKWAEKNLGEKYKGRSKKLIDWYRNHDIKATELRTAKPDRSFDENDDEYKALLASKPRIEPLDYKKIQRGMIEESVSEKLRKENEGELTEVRRKQRELELKPKIADAVKEFTNGVTDLLEETDFRKAIKEGGEESAAEFKMEEKIRETLTKDAADLAEEYTKFAGKLVKFDKDNPKHKWLFDFINNQGQHFATSGGKRRVKDGKSFMPRLEFLQLQAKDPTAANKHWTFGHRDVLELLAVNTKMDIEKRIEDERARLKDLGFERKAKAPSAKTPKEDVKPLNPPKAKVTPAKGGDKQNQKPSNTQASTGIDVLTTLGLQAN